MPLSTIRSRGARLGLMAAAVLALGAGEAVQSIDAGGLTFEAPKAWKSSPPTSSMRRVELKVPPAKGDENPAELVVFAFPAGAGTVQANLERWRGQFKDADGKPPEITSKEVRGKNVDVIRAETAGHYYPSQFPGRPKEPDRPNYRLLGAIVQTQTGSYFLKMVGPDRTMKDAAPAFDALIASIKAGD